MAKAKAASAKQNIKKSFGTRKKGVAKKKLNKHENKKPYNRQGR